MIYTTAEKNTKTLNNLSLQKKATAYKINTENFQYTVT